MLLHPNGTPVDDQGIKRCFSDGCPHMLVDDGDPMQRCGECLQEQSEQGEER